MPHVLCSGYWNAPHSFCGCDISKKSWAELKFDFFWHENLRHSLKLNDIICYFGTSPLHTEAHQSSEAPVNNLHPPTEFFFFLFFFGDYIFYPSDGFCGVSTSVNITGKTQGRWPRSWSVICCFVSTGLDMQMLAAALFSSLLYFLSNKWRFHSLAAVSIRSNPDSPGHQSHDRPWTL